MPIQLEERTDDSDDSGMRGPRRMCSWRPSLPAECVVELTYTRPGTEHRVLAAIRLTR